jgi:hypothetical protein
MRNVGRSTDNLAHNLGGWSRHICPLASGRMKLIVASVLLALCLAHGGALHASAPAGAGPAARILQWRADGLHHPAGIHAQPKPAFASVGDFLKGGPKGLTLVNKALAATNLSTLIANFNGTLLFPTDAVGARQCSSCCASGSSASRSGRELGRGPSGTRAARGPRAALQIRAGPRQLSRPCSRVWARRELSASVVVRKVPAACMRRRLSRPRWTS